jgi:hypothetical protein
MQLSKREFSKLSENQKKQILASKNNQKNKQQKRPLKSKLGSGISPMSKAPIAQTRTVKTGKPTIRQLRNGDIMVTHREYIGEIAANAGGPPSTFSLQSFSINPGLTAIFPWLSKLAQNYESYRFEKLKFCYETESPSTLGGTLVMAVDYDSLDASPTSKQQAMAYRASVRSAPWNDCCHTSVAEDLHKLKSNYIRSLISPPPVNSDLKTYDIGNLFVITQGISTASATCGELYVEYSVHLLTPVYDIVPVTSVAQGTAGTSAAVISAGLNISGNLISGVVGNVVSFQNLMIGNEYFLTSGFTAGAGTQTFSALVGLTIKSGFVLGGSVTSETMIATATVGSITITESAATTNPYITFSNVPNGTL